MCRKMKLWGLLLISFGIGFLVSGLISSILLRFLLGFILIIVGFLMLNRR